MKQGKSNLRKYAAGYSSYSKKPARKVNGVVKKGKLRQKRGDAWARDQAAENARADFTRSRSK